MNLSAFASEDWLSLLWSKTNGRHVFDLAVENRRFVSELTLGIQRENVRFCRAIRLHELRKGVILFA